jgi:hypothetical protein
MLFKLKMFLRKWLEIPTDEGLALERLQRTNGDNILSQKIDELRSDLKILSSKPDSCDAVENY